MILEELNLSALYLNYFVLVVMMGRIRAAYGKKDDYRTNNNSNAVPGLEDGDPLETELLQSEDDTVDNHRGGMPYDEAAADSDPDDTDDDTWAKRCP